VEHIELLKLRHGITHFSLADLAAPFKMLDELSRRLISRRTGILWDAMARADDRYTPEFARRLYNSGCTNIFFGLETSDRESLVRIRKGITLETFERSARACAAAGISVSAFLLSYPGQGGAELGRSLAYAKKLRGSLADIVVARFELGRASNSMRHLGELGISLPAGSGRDTRSFSLPYSAKKDAVELTPALEASLRLRRAGRSAAAKEILLLRPPSLRVCGVPDNPVLHGTLPFLHDLARQLASIHSLGARVIDCAARGTSLPEPGPALRCGNFGAEGLRRETRWVGLSIKEIHAALRGSRPAQIVVSSGFVHDYMGVHRVLYLCRELFPDLPLIVGGPYATLCPEHALAAGAGCVFGGLFFNTGPGGELEDRGDAVRLARGCACGKGDCAVAALEGPVRRERDLSLLLKEIAHCGRTAVNQRVQLLGTASLRGPSPALERLLREFPLKGRRLPDFPEGIPCAALTPELAARLSEQGNMFLPLITSARSPDGLKRELKEAGRILDSAGFPRSQAGVLLTLGNPEQSAGELEEAAGIIENCLFITEPRLYTPTPGTSDFKLLGRRHPSVDMAELNPWLWPLAGKDRTVQQLDALYKRLTSRPRRHNSGPRQ